MADHNTTTSETTSTTNHLGTNIPSGNIENEAAHNEKQEYSNRDQKETHAPAGDDDDEEEDMDALIDELESQDGAAQQEDEEEDVGTGEAPPVPEELLQTDTRQGLSEHEVGVRRKKFGLNQMKEEKENLVLKFLGYFVGPIQFVMEVCISSFLFSPIEKLSHLTHSMTSLLRPVPLTSSNCQAKKKAKHCDQCQ